LAVGNLGWELKNGHLKAKTGCLKHKIVHIKAKNGGFKAKTDVLTQK